MEKIEQIETRLENQWEAICEIYDRVKELESKATENPLTLLMKTVITDEVKGKMIEIVMKGLDKELNENI